MKITNRFKTELLPQLKQNYNIEENEDSIMLGDSKKASKKRQKQKEYSFELGEREGNTRIVNPNAISVEIVNGKKIRPRDKNRLDNHDGSVDSSAQGHRGDCYLLAEINAIRNTKYGQDVLNSNLKWHGDNSVTVTLPGAVKIRKEYEKQGLKCEVTGNYYITADALEKAGAYAGESYSKKDLEVIIFEIAMENFRAEMVRTKELNKGIKYKIGSAEEAISNDKGKGTNDFLSGGRSYDAGFILTGEKSEVYMGDKKKYKNAELYIHGKYGFISREEMERRTAGGFDTPKLKSSYKGVSEVTSLSKDEKKMSEMLEKYKGHEDEFALTFSVIAGKEGKDGHTKKGGGHALTIIKITDDIIYCSNPWTPDKIEPIPRAEFIKMCTGLNAMNVKKVKQDDAQTPNPSKVLDMIVGKMNLGQLADNPQRITISSDKLQELVDKYNEQNPENKISVNTLVKIMNNLSNTKMDKQERERFNDFLSGFSPDSEGLNPETIAYYNKKYSK